MTSLNDAIPEHRPGRDAAVAATKAALSVVPFAGPPLAETLAVIWETRQSARQHEFNTVLAQAFDKVLNQLDDETVADRIAASDEFIAAVTRVQRVAAETASEEKRRRLAAAVANGGSWASFSASERQQFTRLVEEFDQLHVWLLHYFKNPGEWLKAHNMYEQHANLYMGGIESPLESAFNAPKSAWGQPVTQAAADLERAGLAQIPLTTMMSVDGVFAPRTNDKGVRFLQFIDESDSISIEPPQELSVIFGLDTLVCSHLTLRPGRFSKGKRSQ